MQQRWLWHGPNNAGRKAFSLIMATLIGQRSYQVAAVEEFIIVLLLPASLSSSLIPATAFALVGIFCSAEGLFSWLYPLLF